MRSSPSTLTANLLHYQSHESSRFVHSDLVDRVAEDEDGIESTGRVKGELIPWMVARASAKVNAAELQNVQPDRQEDYVS